MLAFIKRKILLLYVLIHSFVLVNIWIVFASLFKLSWFNGVSDILAKSTIKKVYFLSPLMNNFLFEKHDSNHARRDVNTIGGLYFKNVMKLEVFEITSINDLPRESNNDSAVITWIAGVSHNFGQFPYFLKILSFAIKLRRHKYPCIVMMPDSFYVDAAIISTMLTRITGGIHIFLGNSRGELEKYGYSNIVSPVIWPPMIFKIVESNISKRKWEEKENICLLASGESATPVRIRNINKLAEKMLAANIKIKYSNGALSEDQYVEMISLTKFYATTNLVQDTFLFGPGYYRNKMSQTTITGRTWDAFAGGVVLITNNCEVLAELGFMPGVHFLDLDKITSDNFYILPHDSDLKDMANKGHVLLRSLLDNQTNIWSKIESV